MARKSSLKLRLFTALVALVSPSIAANAKRTFQKAELVEQWQVAAPFARNASVAVDNSLDGLSARQTCPSGSGLCELTGRCCRDPSDACCNTDGTCITKLVHFCCSISGACKHDWVCCSGCSPPGSSCCNNNGDYCEKGKQCCPGGCAPEGSTCCKNNRHCRDGLYCVEIDGEPGCCTTPTCREEFPPVTVYYEVITYYWYVYWYIYMYVSVEIDVTTTTVSLTSTQTSTTTRVSVSASDEYDASSYFDDMSSSLESSASRSVDAKPTETPSTVLVADGTTAPYTPRPTAADPGVTTRPDDFDFHLPDNDDDDDGGDPGGLPMAGGGGLGASAASGMGPVGWLVWMGVAVAAGVPGVPGVFMVLL